MNLFEVYNIFDIEPIRGEGCWVWDKKSIKYLDMYGGHAVISIGHSHPEYINAISSQISKLGFYSNSVLNSLQKELAAELGEASGYQNARAFFCNSGAEAVENALKLASFHTNRRKIVCFTGAFHGRTSLAVAASDFPRGVSSVNDTSNIIRIPWNNLEAATSAVCADVAAVIFEGIQGISGVNIPSVEFVQHLRRLCDESGACLIADEVQSGFGRSGVFFAHQLSGVKADIITMAKGMGNGFPLGGIIISEKISPRLGMLGSTFGGNHLACVAGLTVLKVIQSEDLMANAADVGEYLLDKIEAVVGVKSCRGRGLMIAVELDVDAVGIRKQLLFDHKIFTGSASAGNTIRLLPPLALTKSQADLFVTALGCIMENRS